MKWSERPVDYAIEYDDVLTGRLNNTIRERFGSKHPRVATHASDLFMCLRKAHARIKLAGIFKESKEEEGISDETLLTWTGGLMFEDLISTGEKQAAMAWCPSCNTVTGAPEEERADCPHCGTRWLLATPDYIDNGVIHESKQTRKSRKQGPANAPWWIDQLRTYLMIDHIIGIRKVPFGELVINWLMGDYGSRKKGSKPIPPQSALDAYKVIFTEGFEEPWKEELLRRKGIVEGEERPSLNGMGEGDERSPAYTWECGTCPVGLSINCEMYKWDEDGNEIEVV